MTPQSSPWSRLFDEERDAYVLGLLRLVMSVLLFLNGSRLIAELLRGGYFGEFFHLPLVPEALVPSRIAFELLLGCQALACAVAFVGRRGAREALLIAASIGLFVLGCDRLQYHNNRYALLLIGFLLAFTPCDRSFILGWRGLKQLPPDARRAPTFARRLIQLQVSLVYLGSAGGKLLDPDWRGGQVMLLRFIKTAEICAQHGFSLPHWLELTFASPLFASISAKAAITTELFIALGSWWPHTRRAALWVGVLFHFWIEVSARVELFSWLMLASYFTFVVPEVRQRRFEYDPDAPLACRLARLLPFLDWFARFEIAPLEAHARARTMRVTDRDGHSRTGMPAWATLASAIPLLFPLWLPAAVLARAARRSRA